MADPVEECITKDEFDRRMERGELYKGFVIGYGYAFYHAESNIVPQDGYGEVLIGYIQLLDDSPEMKKLSYQSKDGKCSLPTALGLTLGVESLYSDMFHNHDTYLTTRKEVRPIYRVNGKTGRRLGVLSKRAAGFAKVSKGLQFCSFTGGVISTGLSGYNAWDSWSKGEEVDTMDAINVGVGTTAVVGTLVENFIKRGIIKSGVVKFCVSKLNTAAALYSWTSMWFELGQEFGPSTWYGDDDTKWFK